MTHGKWGEIQSGALHFDFTDKQRVPHNTTVTSQQVLAACLYDERQSTSSAVCVVLRGGVHA